MGIIEDEVAQLRGRVIKKIRAWKFGEFLAFEFDSGEKAIFAATADGCSSFDYQRESKKIQITVLGPGRLLGADHDFVIIQKWRDLSVSDREALKKDIDAEVAKYAPIFS